MSDDSFNGWSNRETWLINLWYAPEDISDIDLIKEDFEEQVYQLPAMIQDFIYIESINWDELKAALKGD